MTHDANTQINEQGTQPPFRIKFRYASGIEDFSRMRFWDWAAADQYGRERAVSPSIIGWTIYEGDEVTT